MDSHCVDLHRRATIVGSATNVMMEDIATRNGVTWRHIPYKGESDVLTAVVGGQVTAYAGSTTVQPLVKAGKMRMLVTWGADRGAQYPETPTLHDLDGTPPANAPFDIAGPKDMPTKVVAKLHDVFKEVAESEAFQQILTQYGQELVYLTAPFPKGKGIPTSPNRAVAH